MDAVSAFLIEQRQALRASRTAADAASAASHLGATLASAASGKVPHQIERPSVFNCSGDAVWSLPLVSHTTTALCICVRAPLMVCIRVKK